MSKMSGVQLHNQIHHEACGSHEEVVEVTNNKGDKQVYKLDHANKKVFIGGGPEEDCAWKHTNGSYESVMSMLGRSEGQVLGVASEPVESVPVGVEA